jgi:hypothetical protein
MDATCADEQARYLAGETTAADHIADCHRCAPELASLDAVRTELADEAMWLDPSPALESRIMARTGAASIGRRPRSTHRWLLAAAAFVLGVLAAVVVQYAMRSGGPHADAHITLHATPLAPSAGATAALRETTGGLRIDLHAHDLGRAPRGYFYQCWLKGPSGAVAVGTFHTGTADIVLWSGVPLDRYPTMTVTLEREDGNPASSGRVVLAGTVR